MKVQVQISGVGQSTSFHPLPVICGPRCVDIGVSQCVVSVARPLRRARSGVGGGRAALEGSWGPREGG